VAERRAFPLRLPEEIYEAVRRWADDDLRSVNAQIEFLLVRALREGGRLSRAKAEKREPPRTKE
jgi:hypothetical protein